MEPEEITVGQEVWFFDRSWSDRKCIVAKVEGRDVYLKAEHNKLSSPFLCDWLRPQPVRSRSKP